MLVRFPFCGGVRAKPRFSAGTREGELAAKEAYVTENDSVGGVDVEGLSLRVSRRSSGGVASCETKKRELGGTSRAADPARKGRKPVPLAPGTKQQYIIAHHVQHPSIQRAD